LAVVLYYVRGRVAIVTGSGRGIGRAVAVRLAREGVRLVVNAKRGLEEVLETVRLIREVGGEAVYVMADVSTREGCRALVGEALRAFGELDILVNNAGVGLYSPFLDMGDELVDKHVSTDFKSIVYCSQEAARVMNDPLPALSGAGSLLGSWAAPSLRGLRVSHLSHRLEWLPAGNAVGGSPHQGHLRHGVHPLAATLGSSWLNIITWEGWLRRSL